MVDSNEYLRYWCDVCDVLDEEGDINNLFLHCEVEASVWSHFIARCGIAWCSPQSLTGTVESWIRGHFAGCGRILLRLTFFSILWSIWKERNYRIFYGPSSSVAALIASITLRIATWALFRKDFSSFSFTDIFVNWELYELRPYKGQ